MDWMKSQKTEQIPVQVMVPVLACARCKAESACQPRFEQAPNGMTVVLMQPHYTPVHLGQRSFFLCKDCFDFLEGAVQAMGIDLAVN